MNEPKPEPAPNSHPQDAIAGLIEAVVIAILERSACHAKTKATPGNPPASKPTSAELRDMLDYRMLEIKTMLFEGIVSDIKEHILPSPHLLAYETVRRALSMG